MKPKPNPEKPHIILPEPEVVPFSDPPVAYGDAVYDEDDEAPEYGTDYGTCDAIDCLVMYDPSANDHCGIEGVCWVHCSDPSIHGADPGPALVPGIDPWGWGKFTEFSKQEGTSAYGSPLLIGEALVAKAKADSIAFGAIKSAVNSLNAQDVYEWAAQLMDEAVNAPTPADKVALFVAGIEAIARSEHGQVVAFSEGRSLAKHMADYGGNECGVCEHLRKYSEVALDLLKPIAIEQMQVQEEVKAEKVRVSLGLCVDCGESSERQYSLEEGKGYMCARCAGPFLLMDDGLPGDDWQKED